MSESRVLHELGKTFFSTEFIEFTKFGSEACAMAGGVILDRDQLLPYHSSILLILSKSSSVYYVAWFIGWAWEPFQMRLW
jgi:hypothetical protein